VVCPPGLVDVPRRAAHFVGRAEEGALLVVEDMVRVLGEGDRQTLEAFVELSAIHRSAYRTLDAVRACSRAEAGLSAEPGEDHPETLMAGLNLADLYGFAGQAERARVDFEELLPVCVRVFGEHHPVTVSVVKSLAEPPS